MVVTGLEFGRVPPLAKNKGQTVFPAMIRTRAHQAKNEGQTVFPANERLRFRAEFQGQAMSWLGYVLAAGRWGSYHAEIV